MPGAASASPRPEAAPASHRHPAHADVPAPAAVPASAPPRTLGLATLLAVGASLPQSFSAPAHDSSAPAHGHAPILPLPMAMCLVMLKPIMPSAAPARAPQPSEKVKEIFM